MANPLTSLFVKQSGVTPAATPAPTQKPSLLSAILNKPLPASTRPNANLAKASPLEKLSYLDSKFKPVLEEGRSILQAAPRAVAQTTLGILNGPGKGQAVTQKTGLQKLILGEKPIDPQESFKAGQKAAAVQNKITPGSSPMAKLSRISGLGLGALMVGGLKAADVALPEGEGAAKKAIQETGEKVLPKVVKGAEELLPKLLPSAAEDVTVNTIKKIATSKPAQEVAAVERLTPKNIFPKEVPQVSQEKNLLEQLKTGEQAPTPLTQKTPGQPRIPEGSTPGGVPSEAPRELSSYSEGVAPIKENVKSPRLEVSENAQKSLDEGVSVAKPRIEEVVGKKLTNKEVEAYAQETGKVMEETIGREETLKRAAENLNLRKEIAKVAEDGKITPDFIDMLVRDRAASADTARQLQARKIVAKPDQLKKIDTVIDAVMKKEKDFEKVIDAAKGVDWNDADAVTKFYRTHVKPNMGEWVDTLRYNSMLSSPLTHIQNVASNFQGTALIAPIEKAIAGGVDAIKSALTGSARTKYAGESLHYAKGYLESVGNASRALKDSLSGKNFGSIPDLIDVPMYTKGPLAKVEKVLKAPVRLLEASDQFFNALVEGGAKRSLAYRMSKGTEVKDVAGAATKEAAERLFRGELGKKGEGWALDAIDAFTGVVMQARASQNPVVSTIAKFTLPFVRTPVNILKQGIEYSPLGIANLPGAANKSEKIAKILMGIGTTTAAASLLGQDRITWGTPTDKKEKEDFLAAGMQPYSVKIGDKWYSYSKLHPALAFNLALFAALHEGNKRGEIDDTMLDKTLSGVAKWGEFFADQSYMKQIGDLMSAAKGDAEAGGKLVANYASQLIPARALMGWVNNIIDPVQRAADTDGSLLDQQMQWIMTQIPGLSKNVPARTDSKGAPIMKPNNILNAFSPVKTSTGNAAGEERYNERVQANVEYAGERKEQRKESSAQQDKARAEYQRLLKLPKEEANAELERIKGEDKRLYDDMAEIHKASARNYTIDEENLRTLNIENGFRAAHIWSELQNMESDEERNAYLQDLEEKKIMTEDVSNQLGARYILDATSKMKTQSEKNTFLDGLRKQGRLNKGVEQELRRLTSQ